MKSLVFFMAMFDSNTIFESLDYSEIRMWSSVTGQYRLEAQFIRFRHNKVVVRDRSGVIYRISPKNLSPECVLWYRLRLKEIAELRRMARNLELARIRRINRSVQHENVIIYTPYGDTMRQEARRRGSIQSKYNQMYRNRYYGRFGRY